MLLTRTAVAQIRTAIVSGRLTFGEPLSEAQLAIALGMSKAPVRAALIELREKGLVTIEPQAGTYVCSPTSDDIDKLSSFRCLVETDAMCRSFNERRDDLLAALTDENARMTLARKRRNGADYIAADTAYHLAFITLSGNQYILQAYDLISGIVEALRVRLFNAGLSFRQQSFEDHVEILHALRATDVDRASSILKDHIMRTVHVNEGIPAAHGSIRRSTRSADDYKALFLVDGKGGPR